MTFLYYFAATIGIVFGSLCGIALFVVVAIQAEEYWIKYKDWRWEQWWKNR